MLRKGCEKMDSFFKDTLPHNRAFSEMLRPAKEQVKRLSPDSIAQKKLEQSFTKVMEYWSYKA